jgi:hypothetical protein
VSDPVAVRGSAVRRRLRYVWLKLQYNSLAQRFLDTLRLVGIEVGPYRLYLEGLALLGDDHQAEATGFDGYVIRPIQRSDIKLIALLPDYGSSEASLRHRLDGEVYSLGVWRGNELAAFGWCDLKRCNFPDHPFDLNADEGYLYDAYTSQAFRGTGLAPALRCRMYADLARMGRTKLYSVSASPNTPAIRFKEKLKAQVIDSGVAVRFFRRWHFCWQRNGFRLR